MKTPYTVLAIPETADDKAVKKAYLEAVRQNPPDRHPNQFRRIRRAYEQIATKKDRLRYELFDNTCPDRMDIAEALFRHNKGGGKLTEKTFSHVLKHAVENTTVPLG